MPLSEWERLRRRIAAMHRLWTESTADLTTEQVNYQERPGVLPISFSLLHYVQGEDRNVSLYLLDEEMLWEQRDWLHRIGGEIPGVRRGAPVAEAETARIGDLDAWRDYQAAVFARTESGIVARPPSRYNHEVFPELPEPLQLSFVGMVIEPGEPVHLGELLDGFVYQHGVRHLGEIDHARSLLGLTGVS
jgi:hypothetical protein